MDDYYLQTRYKINDVDLGAYIEFERDGSPDTNPQLPNYNFSSSAPVAFPTSRMAVQGSFPGAGIDINPYFNSDLGTIPLLLRRGHRPRVSVSVLNFSRAYAGTSQRTYYYLSRTDTDLWIYRSYSRDSGYIVQERISLYGTPTNYVFDHSNISYRQTTGSFLYSGIPHYVFVELFGGGGGGAGGTFTYIAWISGRYSYGGSGGSGAGTCYMKIPVGPWRSDWSNRSFSTDYCFSIHKGGNGGRSGNWNDGLAKSGSDGTDSYAYFPDGSIMATAIRGAGGTGWNNPTPAYTQNSSNVLYQINGGAGGQDSAAGSSIYIPESAYLDGERVQLLWSASYGGAARGDQGDYAGGGGGASRGDGAAGAINPGQSGHTAYLGGGGGGGWGQLYSDRSGGSGGPGGVSFFY